MASAGQRADLMVVTQGLATTRSRAQALILAGQICLAPSGRRIDKAGTVLPAGASLVRRGGEPMPFVSRGGLKLEAALSHWQVPVAGAIAVDVGASTGGFTDCLLQRGARRVFALDVGHNQLDYRLRTDRRVSSKEGCNVRTAPAATLPVRCNLAVADVSFISLLWVLPAMLRWLADDGWLICLVKPQFELTPACIGKGGIVRQPALRAQAIERVRDALAQRGWPAGPALASPICGHGGNQEYLLAARRGGAPLGVAPEGPEPAPSPPAAALAPVLGGRAAGSGVACSPAGAAAAVDAGSASLPGGPISPILHSLTPRIWPQGGCINSVSTPTTAASLAQREAISQGATASR